MNEYKILKDKQQQEFNEFPCFFAFSNEQFYEGMEKLELDSNDTDKLYKGFGGMFYKKEDSKKLHNMLKKHDEEMKQAIKKDITGEKFIYDMFIYELANHEYGYTHDLDDTLNVLNLTLEEIKSNKNLFNGLNKAIEYIKENIIC